MAHFIISVQFSPGSTFEASTLNLFLIKNNLRLVFVTQYDLFLKKSALSSGVQILNKNKKCTEKFLLRRTFFTKISKAGKEFYVSRDRA